MKLVNWLLYEVHRWLGIALALFMFTWFSTGLVIMYATPTTQNRSQQLAHAESLKPEAGWLSLGEVWQRSAEARAANPGPKLSDAGGKQVDIHIPPAIADARLVRIGGDPLWLIDDTLGQRYALSALDGSLHRTSVAQALEIARHWSFAETGKDVSVSLIETVDNPVILRNQDALKPFHHLAVGNDGLELMISARTGEILHVSNPWDRALYYTGNWLHLFKPLESLGWGTIRHDVQLWSGLTATIAGVTGLVIGWLRWRPGFGDRKTYSQGRTQPYRESWMVWHFWSGLIGGALAIAWALSGFVSTNPNKWFSDPELSKAEAARFLGDQVPAILQDWTPNPLNGTTAHEIVEINLRRLGSEAVVLAYGRDGQRLPQVLNGAVNQFSKAGILAAAQLAIGNASLLGSELMTEYDSYYYPRHHQGLIEKPLPVVKLAFADKVGTELYVDPQDGRVLAKLDQSRRVYRWLYSALHHWDFGWFYYRPLWDIWMLVWVSFGLVLGASSLVIGWRRLKRIAQPKKRRKTSADIAVDKLVSESGVN